MSNKKYKFHSWKIMNQKQFFFTLFSAIILIYLFANPKDLSSDLLHTETIFDFKGDSIGITGFQNNKSYVQISNKLFERPIQCDLIGNLKENRLFLTRSYTETKPYAVKKFLQIMDLNGNVIFGFDRNSPVLTSLVPSTNFAFSPNGNVLIWGIKKDQDKKSFEAIKLLDKNGNQRFYLENPTNQKDYHFPNIAINKKGEFLVCYTQDLIASPNRKWIFKYHDESKKITWEYSYKGYFVRDVSINEKGDLFFISDDENFKTNRQELYIVKDKGQITKTKSLDKIYTDIYYKPEGRINLRRRLISEEDQNLEIVIK